MKSVTTFIRQQLKIKGKSEHNGRGVWEMGMTENLTYDEIVSKINSKLETWKDKGLVESSNETLEDGVRNFVIKFNEEIFNPFYSELYINSRMTQFGMLGSVCFTSPRDSTRAMMDMYGLEL